MTGSIRLVKNNYVKETAVILGQQKYDLTVFNFSPLS